MKKVIDGHFFLEKFDKCCDNKKLCGFQHKFCVISGFSIQILLCRNTNMTMSNTKNVPKTENRDSDGMPYNIHNLVIFRLHMDSWLEVDALSSEAPHLPLPII
jgi:hypothetical protein